jgi:uncharacterized glyoxalase superfamily protein PhnB
MIERTLHVIAVPDLGRAKNFYCDVLGFDEEDMGDGGWRMFVSGACRIMAGECRDALAPAALGDHSYFAYLVVDDVDAFFARVNGRAEIGKPLRDEPWGMREFGVRAPDGHRIMIGQSRGKRS